MKQCLKDLMVAINKCFIFYFFILTAYRWYKFISGCWTNKVTLLHPSEIAFFKFILYLFFFSGKSVKLKPPAHLLLVVSTMGSGVVAGIVLESRISTYIFGNELKISAHLCRIQKWCRNTLQNVLIARSRQDRSWSGPWFYLFIFYIYKIVPQTIELPVHILLAPFSSGVIFMLWVRHLEGDLKG